MYVTKRDGTKAMFDHSKLRKWVTWVIRNSKDQIEKEYELLSKVTARLVDGVSTEDINDTIISVCLDKEDIEFSRIAGEVERANILKYQSNILGIMHPESITFYEFMEVMEARGFWKTWVEDTDLHTNKDKLNSWYSELEGMDLEFCTIKQFTDKYAIKVEDRAIETPAQAALAISIALHGFTDLALETAKSILSYKINLPTPVLTGCRDGNFDTISCSVIESGDTVDSLEVAEHLASKMTSKKAGIGITLDTRSKGDPVKDGRISHLGKAPLFKSVEAGVKKFTQLARGGSATITVKAIDPDIQQMFLWKTQRIDLAQRIDKVDYSFAYNDAFVEAVMANDDWYLFSKEEAPEVHEAFHLEDYTDVVAESMLAGKRYTKVKALDILIGFIQSRWETGRFYCINLSRANEHTPFMDTITQSNLCMEIALPTKPFVDMHDIYRSYISQGEIAYCSLAALNVSNISSEEYFHQADVALRTVEAMIVKAATCALTDSVRRNLLSRRSVGIGITGLAGKLYKEGLDYDGSQESLLRVEEISELHYYALLKASQAMVTDGTCPPVKGIDNNWLPIDTMHTYRHPLLSWEYLRGKPRGHSVLVAHMPTESSSLFSNATNGIYPSREKVIYKSARRGKVQFISEHFVEGVNLKAWEVDMVPYYQAVQNYTDQAISSDYYTDFTKYPNKKVPLYDCIRWFVRQAKAGIKTAYYQNFIDSKGEEVELEETCVDGGCKL
jgi:ribonucleotide reductase alpha subunit